MVNCVRIELLFRRDGEVINEALILKIGKLNRCVSVMWSKKPHSHPLLRFFFFCGITESIWCACDTLRVNRKRIHTHTRSLTRSRRKSAKIMKNKKKTMNKYNG